jgi:hypothetical protein
MLLAGSDPAIVDLIVVYTPQAKLNRGGDATIQSLIQAVVDTTNQAMINSRIGLTIRLVHMEEIAYTASGDLFVDRIRLHNTSDGFMDSVHALRNTWGADLVSLISDSSLGGGNADLLANLALSDNDTRAFSVVDETSLQPSNLTMAHELGHTLGGGHERGNVIDPAVGPFPYSYGYRFTAGGVLYHDIMSYDPGLAIPHYANPAVSYRGTPTGSAIGQPDEADLASTFAVTGPYVAAYRPTVVSDSSGPSAALYEVARSGSTLTFTVQYRDAVAVDAATLDPQDVFVTTPEGFNLSAEFLGVDWSANAWQKLARYRVTLPASNPPAGALTFQLRSGQVRDVGGNTAPSGQLAGPSGDTAGWDLPSARDLGQLSGTRIVTDAIDDDDQTDIYQFTIAAQSTVSLALSGLSAETNVLLIQDVNNNAIYDFTTDLIVGTFFPNSSADRGIARNLAPGEYYAWVYSADPGSYHLTLRAYFDSTPPTAVLDATDVKLDGSADLRFSVTYSDDQEIDAETARFWSAVDLQVQFDGGGGFTFFTYPDPAVNVEFPQNARSFTANYRIQAFNQTTGFTAQDNSLWTISIHPNSGSDPRVRDAAANNIALDTLGSFRIAIGSADSSAPTAAPSSVPAVLVPAGPTWDVVIEFRDNVAIDASTIGAGDVRVTGPGGFNQLATWVSTSPPQAIGSSRRATYRISAPGGSWDVGDNGNYVVSIEPNSVLDTSGNPVMAGNVSSLTVDVPLPGDANNDDRVNLSDFNIVAGNFGAVGRGVEHGDFNFDGVVNLADFNLLASNFGIILTPAFHRPSVVGIAKSILHDALDEPAA